MAKYSLRTALVVAALGLGASVSVAAIYIPKASRSRFLRGRAAGLA